MMIIPGKSAETVKLIYEYRYKPFVFQFKLVKFAQPKPNCKKPIYQLLISRWTGGGLLASAQILMTHGMADGKFGLSVDDIVYSYHGDPKHSKIEIKLNGSMSDKASDADKLEIIKWVRNGAPEEQWNQQIKEIFYSNCISCHSTIPGLPDFTQFEEVAYSYDRERS